VKGDEKQRKREKVKEEGNHDWGTDENHQNWRADITR
jgi:hypothetical protein